jgi:uncharacterized membrane protein (DUF373 family)
MVIVRAFQAVEDIVYVGLGLLLACSALVLLWNGCVDVVRAVVSGSLPTRITHLLDRILLILLIVELLYTVQVSFKEHSLVAQPFLLVGLIATVRRVLVIIAEFGEARELTRTSMRDFVIELGVLTVLILTLVASLMVLRKADAAIARE